MPRPRTTGRKSTDAGQILVRLSAEEHAACIAAAAGLPLGQWARTALLAVIASRAEAKEPRPKSKSKPKK